MEYKEKYAALIKKYSKELDKTNTGWFRYRGDHEYRKQYNEFSKQLRAGNLDLTSDHDDRYWDSKHTSDNAVFGTLLAKLKILPHMTTVPDRINGDLSRFVCGVYCWTNINRRLWTEPWILHFFWFIIEEINLYCKIPGVFKNAYWGFMIYWMLHLLTNTNFYHRYNRILIVDTFNSWGRWAIMLILYCSCKYSMLTTEEDFRSAFVAFYKSFTTYINSTPDNAPTVAAEATTYTLPVTSLSQEEIAGFENRTEGILTEYLVRHVYELDATIFRPVRHCATKPATSYILSFFGDYPHPNVPTAQLLDFMYTTDANFTKSELMRAVGGSDHSENLVLAFGHNKEKICKRLTECGMKDLLACTEQLSEVAANGGVIKPGIIQWLQTVISGSESFETVIWESKSFETESVLTFFFMFLLAFLLFVQRKR
jgi:hypothetical protein